jgi:hypothetical protein
MLIWEYRIILPLTVEEYQVGQLYAVAEASKQETGGGEGIEIIANEPYDNEKGKGQYTKKIFRLSSKVPAFVRYLAPNGALVLHEEAWNGYPHCKTILTNEYMKDNFKIIVESMHIADDGSTENALKLDAEQLKKREVVKMDIANRDLLDPKDYKESEDPALFRSEKTGRGQLKEGWISSTQPVMCCYKLVTCEFKWFGLQSKVEQFIQRTNKNLLMRFHRQVFCWIDRWFGMTMEDIRRIEDETKKELEKKIKEGTPTNQADD